MKFLKGLLFFILGLVALFLIVALFVPKDFTASASLVIQRPKAEIMDYMRILKNQEEYSEWVKADSNLKPVISGEDGTVGAKQSWNSQNKDVGEGEQIITAITEDQIDVDLHFKRPMEDQAKASTLFKAISENETEVTATFFAKGKYPMNVMGYFIGKPIVEKTELQNLKNVKQILESRPLVTDSSAYSGSASDNPAE